MTRKRSDRGFTLMEVLIVVAMIAVLVTIAIPTFTSQLVKTRESVDTANCRNAVAVCSAECMANEGGDFSAKSPAEWAQYAISQGIPANGQADSTTSLAATISGNTIAFTYGDGGSSHTDSLSPNASSVAQAVANLITTSSGAGKNVPTATYQGTSYAYLDMSFNYNYTTIGGTKVSTYLADKGLSSDVSTLKANGYTIIFSGTAANPGSVKGYYYTSPDDSSKVVVVSMGGATQLVDKGTSANQGYYGSLM